jgi:hypothetical protein
VSGVLILLGLLLVLTGSFLAIIGLLGAIGAGFQLRVLPGRSVTAISGLRARLPAADAGHAKSGRPAKARASRRAAAQDDREGAVAVEDEAPRPTRVVVRGRVSAGPGGTYTAPLSGGPCAWYLATQTVVDGDERSTVDRFAAQPFVLTDAGGERVLVGPVCPALEQIPPTAREVRADPHPWFDEAPVGAGEVEVYEFTLTEGQEVLASGELSAAPDGTLRIGGEVVLSAPTAETTAGDPARATLRRDFKMAAIGLGLLCAGALILGTAQHSTVDPDTLHRAAAASPAATAQAS